MNQLKRRINEIKEEIELIGRINSANKKLMINLKHEKACIELEEMKQKIEEKWG
jgi:hypothetical protein